MTLPRHVIILSVLYGLTFLAIFAMVDEWPPYPALTAAIMIIAASLLMAWAPTVRIMRLWPKHENRFLIPSITHAVVLLFLWIGAVVI